MTPISLDNAFVGLLYLMANSIGLLIYAIFLIIFRTKEPYRSSVTFKIMFCLGVVECLQMISGVAAGMMTLAQDNFGRVFEMIVGGFNCCCLFGRPLFLFVLALNRFLSIMNIRFVKRRENLFFNVMLVAAIGFAMSYFVWRMTGGKAHYSLQFDIFEAVPNKIINKIIFTMDTVATGMASIFYLCIFVKILHTRENIKFVKIRTTDITVILQAVITLGHVLVVKCGAGYLYRDLLPNRVFNVVFIAWSMVMSLINPIFYLVCVRSLRKSFLEFCRLKQSSAKVYVKPRSVGSGTLPIIRTRSISSVRF